MNPLIELLVNGCDIDWLVEQLVHLPGKPQPLRSLPPSIKLDLGKLVTDNDMDYMDVKGLQKMARSKLNIEYIGLVRKHDLMVGAAQGSEVHTNHLIGLNRDFKALKKVIDSWGKYRSTGSRRYPTKLPRGKTQASIVRRSVIPNPGI